VQMDYDFQGRRIQRIVSTHNGTSWVVQSTLRYLYDGWNLIAELNAANAVQRTFIWGTDLSGTMQGAGGVGGLLMVRQVVTPAMTHYVAYDGNGNITGLVNASTGDYSALYEYDPFGQTIRITGTMAKNNPFRFSTKYTDDATDMVYYGYRYYNPSTGRWLNRDPIEESGGLNLYGFVRNDSANHFDYFGLKGSGHHVVPWSIFNGAVKEEVQRFFDSDLSRIFNEHYKTHGAGRLDGISAKQYNRLVSAEMEKFLGKQALRDMTLKQAEQFLSHLNSLPHNHPIATYNNAVRREAALAMRKALEKAGKEAAESSLQKALNAGARRGGGRLAKGIPLVGTVVAVYFYAEDAELYGGTAAGVNTTIDAIPFIGTGKTIAELYHGYRFLDVTVGPKAVQPSETNCPK
jgi:RHS repeat-associated protein